MRKRCQRTVESFYGGQLAHSRPGCAWQAPGGSSPPDLELGAAAVTPPASPKSGSQPPTSEMLLQGPRSLGKSIGSARELELDQEHVDRRDHRSHKPPGARKLLQAPSLTGLRPPLE
jgi:hypothetical protein